MNFDIFWGFQKNEYTFGYEDFVDIFWGSSQNWAIIRGHFYAFYGLFLRSRYRMGDIFWVAKFSKKFYGCFVEPQNAPYTICSLEVHIVYPAYTICSP